MANRTHEHANMLSQSDCKIHCWKTIVKMCIIFVSEHLKNIRQHLSQIKLKENLPDKIGQQHKETFFSMLFVILDNKSCKYIDQI